MEEVLCAEAPFLPTANDIWPRLDRLFRLMRHDMVSSLKERVDAIKPAPNGKSKRRAQIYKGAALQGVEFDRGDWYFKISFQLPAGHAGAKGTKLYLEDYWMTGYGKKTFPIDTLVLVSPANKPDQPVFIGQIVHRQLHNSGSTPLPELPENQQQDNAEKKDKKKPKEPQFACMPCTHLCLICIFVRLVN